jgi:drug/metabolite transporter (DMT)-like permease
MDPAVLKPPLLQPAAFSLRALLATLPIALYPSPVAPRFTPVRLPELALLYCAAIWGSTFYVVKDALTDVHPLTLVGWRFLIAGLLMLPVLLRLRVPLLAGWPYGVVLGAIIYGLYAAQTYGLLFTSAANSAFITGLFIIFIPPLGWLLHRHVSGPARLTAVGLALAGLLLLTGGIRGLNVGDLLTLGCAVLYALQVLLTGDYLKRGASPWSLCLQQLVICGVLSLLTAAAVGAPLGVVTPRALWIVAFLMLLPTLSAYLIQLLAQQRVDPLRTALIFTMEPVFGALFAWTLGGEAFVPLRALGGLLIVVAMLVAEAPALRRSPVVSNHPAA